jgi:hypothetical protein
VPLRIQPPLPSETAVVDAAPASLPFPGSVRAKQPSLLPLAKGFSHMCRCCSLPYDIMGAQYSELFTLMITPAEAQPRLISSMATAYLRQ